MTGSSPISITILTGFLGAGKTTLLLSLLQQLPADYKLCLLKNEFGDVEVDSRLASQNSITGVTELLNGCICCNLIGQLSDALLALRDNYKPSRIVIETSGSAFPATLAMEVKRIAAEHKGAFSLDGVIQVIDVENFEGYADTSYTAKLQAKYTDFIILNKCELAGEAKIDAVLDRIRDVAEETPIVRADKKGWIDKDVVFGIDSSLARNYDATQHDHDHASEVDVLSVTVPAAATDVAGGYIDASAFEKLLTSAPKDEVYRIKGIIRFRFPPPSGDEDAAAPATPPAGNRWILNWAFGRWQFMPLRESPVTTTIEAETTEINDNETLQPEPQDLMRARKGSIEVLVSTSIQTVVEEKQAIAAPEAALITLVLSKGEGARWLRKLKGQDWIKFDDRALSADVKIESLS